MQQVLYFHGFASSPRSAKIAALEPLLAPFGIELNAPDLNVPSFAELDFPSMVACAREAGRRRPPSAIVGSSLGSLVALSIAKDFGVPMVLIAPALGIADRWRTKLPDGDPIPVFNHAAGRELPIHRAFFLQMAELHVDDDPPPVRVTVIMGRRDETVPFETVQQTWARWSRTGLAEGSRFIELAEGDHGLVAHADVILESIVEAAKGPPGISN